MQWLRQSTAVTIKLGPFVDSSDGDTDEVALVISQADVRLSKNGGDFDQKHENSACSYDEIGYYDCDLDTDDTNTLGRLRVATHESGALHVWREFMVVPENVWDSLFASDKLQVDLTQVLGVAVTGLGDFKADVSALATTDDVSCTVAVSSTEAEEIATGTLAITLWHTFSQAVSSTVTADLNAATKIWWAVKLDREADIDAEALVFVEKTLGLQYLARDTYAGAAGNGTLAVSGSSGDWTITLGLQEVVTGELLSWKNKSTLRAEVKALVGGDTVNVWSGSCTISPETVRAVA